MWIISLCLSFLLATSACAVNWDPYTEIASPETWDAPKLGQTFMFSGNDPGGNNKDHGNFLRIEPKGATFDKGNWVLAEMNGPGSITRIWVTGRNLEGVQNRINGRINIFIDSTDKPAIDLPIEDFFGKTEPFTPPMAMPTSGGWVNYVPIPFSSYCKVLITANDLYAHRHSSTEEVIPQLYYHINWRKVPTGANVEPFSLPLSDTRTKLLKKAAAKMEWTPSAADAKSFTIAPGQKVEVFRAEGQGRITELTLASENMDDLWLTAHWDGSETPAIDTPARMFFLEGLTPRPFKSLPFIFDGKIHACRIPMPYANGARIYLKNTADRELTAAVAATANKTGRSHMRLNARYTDKDYAKRTPDIVVLDSNNGPGHYIGVLMVSPQNFLEGNEIISTDGAEPGWKGTGTEDYFNGGWYFCQGTYDQPFSGCIHKGNFVTSYRFHLADTVPYSKSIKVTLEHGASNRDAGRARWVVYWYEAPDSANYVCN